MTTQTTQDSALSEKLKTTGTRCPHCHMALVGEVWKTDSSPAQIIMRRTCPEHGPFESTIASDAAYYWLSKGSSKNLEEQAGDTCCSADGNCCGSLGSNANTTAPGVFDTLSTCIALIEIVDSCNLSCPTCFAGSPLSQGAPSSVPLDEIKQRIEHVIEKKEKIEILQLSGGEPTLHPHFFELLQWTQEHPNIDFVLVNTNGVKIATDDVFFKQLEQAAKRRKLQLYLQFDGPQEAGQKELRSADLRDLRFKVIERCTTINLPITLAMTVTDQNLPYIWDTIEFGLRHLIIRGVTFQPLFKSGRHGENGASLNAADVLQSAIEKSKGQLSREDFTPLPCGDPNCDIIGYMLRQNGEIQSVSQILDWKDLQGFLKDRVRYTTEDLVECGCESEPLGQVLKEFELKGSSAFRIMVKPFMDAWSWDQDRIDRCCTHVIQPDGSLDSFCRHYAKFQGTSASCGT